MLNIKADPLTILSTSNMPSAKAKCEHSGIILPLKKVYFQGPYRPQNWSFRNSIINYITKNPSTAKVWEKLIQSCKYFYYKNPIVIVERLVYYKKKWKIVVDIGNNKEMRYTVKNISKTWWIRDRLDMICDAETDEQNFFSSIIPKLYRIDVKWLSLFEQTISLNEFLCISSKPECVSLIDSSVKEKNNSSIVSFEKLFQALPKIKRICFYGEIVASCITSNTVKTLLQIPHFSNVDRFFMNNIPETFDIETFFDYIKKNKRLDCFLAFHDTISDAYKNRLEAIIDEILTTRNLDYKTPHIVFLGLPDKKFRKLHFLSRVF